MAKDAPKMKGWRSRDRTSGRLRKKRADTKLATLAKQYHRRFGEALQLQLGTFLKRRRRKSLKRVLHRPKPRPKSKRRR